VNGHVYLGRLPDVHVVDAICTEDFVNGESSFEVLTNFCTVPQTIHQKTGTLVRLPFTPQDDEKGNKTEKKKTLFCFSHKNTCKKNKITQQK
jgi:hypothetical protein